MYRHVLEAKNKCSRRNQASNTREYPCARSPRLTTGVCKEECDTGNNLEQRKEKDEHRAHAHKSPIRSMASTSPQEHVYKQKKETHHQASKRCPQRRNPMRAPVDRADDRGNQQNRRDQWKVVNNRFRTALDDLNGHVLTPIDKSERTRASRPRRRLRQTGRSAGSRFARLD